MGERTGSEEPGPQPCGNARLHVASQSAQDPGPGEGVAASSEGSPSPERLLGAVKAGKSLVSASASGESPPVPVSQGHSNKETVATFHELNSVIEELKLLFRLLAPQVPPTSQPSSPLPLGFHMVSSAEA